MDKTLSSCSSWHSLKTGVLLLLSLCLFRQNSGNHLLRFLSQAIFCDTSCKFFNSFWSLSFLQYSICHPQTDYIFPTWAFHCLAQRKSVGGTRSYLILCQNLSEKESGAPELLLLFLGDDPYNFVWYNRNHFKMLEVLIFLFPSPKHSFF